VTSRGCVLASQCLQSAKLMDHGKKSASSPRRWLWWTVVAALCVFYVMGIFVSAKATVHDGKSPTKLESLFTTVSLGFVGWKYQQEVPLPDLAPRRGETALFFAPCMKFFVLFQNFTDSQGTRPTRRMGSLYITYNEH